ncbi:glycosylated lysosomal membrane protein [Ambystoma mexicanum]|uniref:glycosylated lysosomal membrane protein n=1 Tax=Ambystoma mexicanum TaxID=8296 RepID=UPI0037E9AF0E
MLRWWLLFLPYLLRVGSHGLAEGEEENYRRQIHVQFNSTYNGTTVNLLHIRAVGQKDTIHYVWSTLGAPTMLLVHTNSAESTLQLDWTKLVSSSPFQGIRIEPLSSVQHSMAVMFTRVFEYYDVNNTADFSHTAASNFYPAYKLADFVWERGDSTFNATTRTAVFRGSSASDTRLFQNGSISFRVTAFDSMGREETPPSLLHTANCSKLEFRLDGVVPRGNFSRFGIELVTLEKKGGHKRMESVRTIDDEYTPTIFEMARMVSNAQNESRAQSFMQWKMVAYGSPVARRDEALPCQYYDLQEWNRTKTLPSVVAQAFFGENLMENCTIQALNLSFGIADGDFYNKNHFLSWSSLVGMGTPPVETFSILVICIMAVALGTPVVLLLVGGLIIFIWKKKRYSDYEPIN